MVHGDRHGIKTRGGTSISSHPGVVSSKCEPDEMKSGGTISSTDTLSSVSKTFLFSFRSSNGIWCFTFLLQDAQIP